MTNAPWWDTAAVIVIGAACLGLIARRLIATFGTSSGKACCGCSKGCGSEGDGKASAP